MDLENTASDRVPESVVSAAHGPGILPSSTEITETAQAILNPEAESSGDPVAAAEMASELSAPRQLSDEGQRSTLAEWAITILLLLFLTTTLVQAYVIPTGSMEDTLLIGDHLLVDKLAYAPAGPVSSLFLPYRDVKRGDIIVFRYPVDIKQTFVKRAIGIPGDHIRIIRKELYLNGVKLNEPYKVHKSDQIDAYRDDFPGDPNVPLDERAAKMLQENVVNGDLLVPPNTVFAMGDNRDNSLDSRYWGFVPRENIIGKPLIIYWSFDAPSDELQEPAIGWRHALDVITHFFSKTRWSRTFQLIHPHPIP